MKLLETMRNPQQIRLQEEVERGNMIVSKKIIGLQATILASLVAIIGTVAIMAPDKNIQTAKLVTKLTDSLGTSDDGLPTSDFNPNEMRVIIRRAQESKMPPEVQMRLVRILYELESSGVITNKNEALAILQTLAPNNTTGFTAAHRELGAAMLKEVHTKLQIDSETKIETDVYAAIEHHLENGLPSTENKNNELNENNMMFVTMLQNIRLILIERFLANEQSDFAKPYIIKLIAKEPQQAIHVLKQLHQSSISDYDEIIYTTAMDSLKVLQKKDPSSLRNKTIEAAIFTELGELDKASNLYEQIGSITTYQSINEEKEKTDRQTVQQLYVNFLTTHVSKLNPARYIPLLYGTKVLNEQQKSKILFMLCRTHLPIELEPIYTVIIETSGATTKERLMSMIDKTPSTAKNIIEMLKLFNLAGLESEVTKIATNQLESQKKMTPTDATVYLYNAELLAIDNKWAEALDSLETTIYYTNIRFKNVSEANEFKRTIHNGAMNLCNTMIRIMPYEMATNIIVKSKIFNDSEKKCLLVTLKTINGTGNPQEYIELIKEISSNKSTPNKMKAALLNNLAWEMYEQIKKSKTMANPQKIVDLNNATLIANKALQMLPNNVEILDTISHIDQLIISIKTANTDL